MTASLPSLLGWVLIALAGIIWLYMAARAITWAVCRSRNQYERKNWDEDEEG